MSFLAYTDDGRTVPSAMGRRLLRSDETAVMIPPPERDPKLVAFESGDHVGGGIVHSAAVPADESTLVGVAGQAVRPKIEGLEEYGPDNDTPMRFLAVFEDGSWIEAVALHEGDRYRALVSGLAFDDGSIYRCFRAESLPPQLVASLRKQVEEQQESKRAAQRGLAAGAILGDCSVGHGSNAGHLRQIEAHIAQAERNAEKICGVPVNCNPYMPRDYIADLKAMKPVTVGVDFALPGADQTVMRDGNGLAVATAKGGVKSPPSLFDLMKFGFVD